MRGGPGGGPPCVLPGPPFSPAAGFRPRLTPPWIGRAPAAKLSRYGAGEDIGITDLFF